MSTGWRWRVSCYYGDDVKPPKRPGDLAVETVHKTEHSRDIDVSIGEDREDIGSVVVSSVWPLLSIETECPPKW